MRTWILVVLIVLLATPMVLAQKPDPVEKRVQQLTKELDLTEKQAEQIRKILQDHTGTKGPKHGQKGMQGGSKGNIDAQIEAVLTDAQKEKYVAMKKKSGSNPELDRMVAQLGLSDTQTAKIGALLAERNDKLKAASPGTKGPKGKGKGSQAGSATDSVAGTTPKANPKEIRDEYNDKIRALLTKEQQAKFDAMQPGKTQGNTKGPKGPGKN